MKEAGTAMTRLEKKVLYTARVLCTSSAAALQLTTQAKPVL